MGDPLPPRSCPHCGTALAGMTQCVGTVVLCPGCRRNFILSERPAAAPIRRPVLDPGWDLPELVCLGVSLLLLLSYSSFRFVMPAMRAAGRDVDALFPFVLLGSCTYLLIAFTGSLAGLMSEGQTTASRLRRIAWLTMIWCPCLHSMTFSGARKLMDIL